MKPPKQKSKELVDKLGKDHALICVEEILQLDIYASDYYYFNEVKKEISNKILHLELSKCNKFKGTINI